MPPASEKAGTGLRAPVTGRFSPSAWAAALRAAILAGGLLSAALLLVSEFTTLYAVTLGANGAQIATVSTHTHDSYALVPIAIAVALLTLGAGASANRLALLAMGVLGLVTLGIALIGDLPDAQTTGAVFFDGRYQSATASPGPGLYLETLAAILLVVLAGCGLLLSTQARRSPYRARGGVQRRRRPPQSES